jgi:opacity protein-like surface antigen
MKRLKINTVPILAASFFALAASSANATDLLDGLNDPAPQGTAVNWTGLSIGAHGGYSNSNHKLEANGETATSVCKTSWGGPHPGELKILGLDADDCDHPGFGYLPAGTPVSALIDGLNSPGFFGGVGGRADVQQGKFVLGVFGDYNISEADTEISLSLDGLPVGTAAIEEGDSWIAGGRAGYLFGSDNRALFYLLAGYEERDVKFSFGDDSTEKTFSGVVAGAGAEYALTDNIFFGVEWQHFFGSKETLFEGDAGLVNPLKVTDDLESDRVMARLRVKLLGGF